MPALGVGDGLGITKKCGLSPQASSIPSNALKDPKTGATLKNPKTGQVLTNPT